MRQKLIEIISKFSVNGLLHRDELKNNMDAVAKLLHLELIRKVHRNKKVFYELTDNALPLIEIQRRILLEKIAMLKLLHKSPSIYHALLGDVRFVNEKNPIAKKFIFLGDWQINKPVVPSQLKLAQHRFYKTLGLK